MPERTGRKVYVLLTEDLADLCLSALVATNTVPQLLAGDHSAFGSRKNAASCDT